MEDIEQAIAQGNLHQAAVLIQQYATAGRDFSGYQVRYAHILALSCNWSLVSKLLPPGMNLLESSGWLSSVYKAKPINKEGQPLPWFTYAAIDFIESRLNQTMRVFEWGAGYSSLWFSARVAVVCSIEDNPFWYGELNNIVPSNVKLLYEQDSTRYIKHILDTDDLYDVIVIDGSSRNACAQIAINKLSDNGFIVFDNADSASYNDGVMILAGAGFYRIDFWGLIPSYLYKNCTSIFFKNPTLLAKGDLPSMALMSTGDSCFQVYNKSIPSN